MALVFGASMHSLLPIDKFGTPLRNAVIWADNRGRDEANALKDSIEGKEIYKQTGTPIHPMSPLVKIRWFKQHTPTTWFEKVHKFISIKEYIIYQLTDALVIDHSMASSTGLFNIHTLQWEGNQHWRMRVLSPNNCLILYLLISRNFNLKKNMCVFCAFQVLLKLS
ncbi:MAG: FGGY family carbohydrate kinase [Spirosomataceae bacterium]